MRLLALPVLLASLAGCTLISESDEQARADAFDADGDGHADASRGGDDCDDGDPTAFPGAEEACDDIDSNCDGSADDELKVQSWPDADGDGYGQTVPGSPACADDPAWVTNNEDCNDSDETINPDGIEICDGADNDCSGINDDNTSETFYVDADEDGYGDVNRPVSGCTSSLALVLNADDCDDLDDTVHPDADETCDDVDRNCNGQTDDDAVDAPTWYEDQDGDGVGGSTTAIGCDPPATGNWSAETDDCDDGNFQIYPGAQELCDALDNNCDGAVDETAPTWWVDDDGDGFGDASVPTITCDPGEGWVSNDADCDDADPAVHPDSVWYPDVDGDGYGDPAESKVTCDPGAAWSLDNTDCDDADSTVNPETEWFQDGDGDTFGEADSGQVQCVSDHDNPVQVGGDCDDGIDTVFPGGDILCDDVSDGDCDGVLDNDADGDGFSDEACGGSDCDDDDIDAYDGFGCGYTDCLEILDNGYSTGTDTYPIDPDGPGGEPAFDVTCDMDTQGGGWTVIGCDDFQTSTSTDGWSHTLRTTCNGDSILGGMGSMADGSMSKTFDLLGVPHDVVRFEAEVWRLDSWDSGSDEFYVRVNGAEQWRHDNWGAVNHNDWCGSLNNNYGDFLAQTQWTDAHTGNTASILFGADMVNTSNANNEAWGIDDVCVSVRREADDDGLLGSSPGNPGDSCHDIQNGGGDVGDGQYWIDPGNGEPFMAWCDMTRDGGGWTLVWVYEYLNYNSWTSTSNAVEPWPSWPATRANTTESLVPPEDEDTPGAVMFELWNDIGDEFLVRSNINHHIRCSPGTGSLVDWTVGSVTCTNVDNVPSMCSGNAPDDFRTGTSGANGPYLRDLADGSGNRFYYYWDASISTNYPDADPCGNGQQNHKTGVSNPGGSLWLR